MPALPKSSLVLVTGANGFIAAHVVDQALRLGYRVRGVVRDSTKGEWLKEHSKRYGEDVLEICVVPDMTVPGAYNAAVRGVSALIHVASDMSFRDDPNLVIPISVDSTVEALRAADSEADMKHFIYCSSAGAVYLPFPDIWLKVDEHTWNDESVRLAWNSESTGTFTLPQPFIVYCASKTEAERAVWRHVQEQQPRYVVNAVLPCSNWGPPLDPEMQQGRGSSFIFSQLLAHGSAGLGFFSQIPPQYFVDVRDTARLHLAPLLDPTIQNERLFGWTDRFDWNEVIEILQKLRPDNHIPNDDVGSKKTMVEVVKRSRAEEILKKNFGVAGFIPKQESIAASIAHLT